MKMPAENVIESIVRKIDMFGNPIGLRLNNHSTAKTVLGGLLTILMLISLLIFFGVFISAIFNKTDPYIAVESEILPSVPAMTINRTNLPIAFELVNYYNELIEDPTIFTVEAGMNYVKTGEAGIKYEPMILGKCETKDLPMITEESFKKNSMGKYMCLKDFNVTLKGFWNEPELSFMSIRVRYCSNGTVPGVICKPKQEITDMISHIPIYFYISLVNNNINPQNYSTPITSFITRRMRTMKSDSFKDSGIYLREDKLLTDNGWLFSDFEESSAVLFDKTEGDDSSIGVDGVLITFSIYGSDNRRTYRRSYTKIQSVVANIGGLGNVLMFVLKYLCHYFTMTSKYESILNNTFRFDFEDNNAEVIKLSQLNYSEKSLNRDVREDFQGIKVIRVQGENKHNNNAAVVHEINNKNLNQYKLFNSITFHIKRNKKVSGDKTLKFSHCEVIMMYFCCCLMSKSTQKKKILFLKGKKVVDDFLDITSYAKKQAEFEKLKSLLLSKKQYMLFDFISKDLYSSNKVEEFNKKFNLINGNNSTKNKELEETKVEQIVNEMEKNTSELNEVDLKLLEILHQYYS